ncbi:MAG: cytochrome C [FCB group bacterium]|jgi:hypothetical protein
MNINYPIKQGARGLILTVLVFSTLLFTSQKSEAVPSFARQTGLSCNSCHTVFPQLNSFGRIFKLNAYTMTNTEVIENKDEDSSGNSTTYLRLLRVLPLSAMFQTAFTHVNKAQPGTMNDQVSFPQQISLLLGGEVTPHIGLFLQITYNDNSGQFAWDNTEVRYSDNTTIGGTDLVYGVTLNNNPTLQDLWNTTPAWGYPYSSSPVAPGQIASPLLAGGLAQSALGLGAYALWNDLVYAEASFYRSAFQGGYHPYNDSVFNVIKGVAPYWRLVLQQQFTDSYISFGTFGMMANTIPMGISGIANRFTDIGADLQFEYNIGTSVLSFYASYINEKQKLDATFAAGNSQNAVNTLNTMNLNASYYFLQRLNLTVGYFSTTGSSDNIIYAPGAFSGSLANKPDTDGLIGEIAFLPWWNTKFSLQYVMYDKFNGSKTNYDGFNRDASHNNTLYLLSWIMF